MVNSHVILIVAKTIDIQINYMRPITIYKYTVTNIKITRQYVKTIFSDIIFQKPVYQYISANMGAWRSGLRV